MTQDHQSAEQGHLHGDIAPPSQHSPLTLDDFKWLDFDLGLTVPLSRAWVHQGRRLRRLGPTLDEVLRDRQQLTDLLGENCNHSYRDLERRCTRSTSDQRPSEPSASTTYLTT
jgi:hypothetical protein